ncbi:hypothetical protein ABPG75_012594 [Micractinium tetrahymenae]
MRLAAVLCLLALRPVLTEPAGSMTRSSCTVNYGDLGAAAKTVPAGGCQLTGDSSADSYSIFGARGASIPFTSGAVQRPPGSTPAAPTPAGAPAGAPPSAPSPTSAPSASYYCAELPPAQEKCGANAYASYVDAAPSDVLLAALKAGATEKFNGDLGNNWERLQCTPTDAAPRIVCKNQYSSDYAIVFDADCGAAAAATIEAQATVSADGNAVSYFGLVHTLCRA